MLTLSYRPKETFPICLMLLLLMGWYSAVFAQELRSVAQVESDYKRIVASAEAMAETPEQLTAILSATKSAVAELKQLQTEIDRYTAAATTPLLSDQELDENIAQLRATYPIPDDTLDTNTVKARLVQYQSSREASLANVTAMKSQLSLLAQRGETISGELVDARESSARMVATVETAADTDSILGEARTLFNQVTQLKSILKLQVLEKELATLPIRQAQLDERIKLENVRLSTLTTAIGRIQSELRQSDLRDAQQLVRNIEQRLKSAKESENQALLAEEQKNLSLARKLTDSSESYYREEALVQATVEKTNEVDTSLRLLDRIISAGRADGDLGEILRRIRGELVSPVQIRREVDRLQSLQVALQLDSILWQDTLDTTEIELQKTTLNDRTVLVERQQTLGLLIDTVTKLDNTLNSRQVALETLNSKSKQLRRGLNGRLLWLPTNEALNASWLPQTVNALAEFINPESWHRVFTDFWSGFNRHTLLAALCYLIGVILLFYRKQFLNQLYALPKRVRNVNLDAHWISPYGLLLSLALALALPLILWVTGWLLSASHEPFTHAISSAMRATADVMLLFSLLIILARPNGVIGGHFGWDNDARESLSSNLSWLMMAIIPATFVFTYAMTIGDSSSQYGLGRTVFLLISLAISYAGYRILKPGNHVVDHMFGRVGLKLLGRVVFFVFAIIPLLLGLLTLVGYFDTSVILQSKLFFSGLLLLSGALIYGFMHRTYEVSSRRDAWRRAKARREARLEKLAHEGEHNEPGESMPNFEAEEFASLDEINRQAKTVIWFTTIATIVVGFYLLWQSVFPALDITESVVLWQGIKMVDGVAVTTPINLGDLIVAIVLIIGGFILARNLRGILALGISQRLSMRPGTEYAATTILGYIAVASGVVFGLSQLGLDWGKLQWVVAAMGVGLGFGLQEIVANFVSGLIILFERPIRVGDIVTIGNLDGVVTKISIRATTIKDYDKRDVLIPNKKIITDNVSNWTLNDSMTRLLIKIGVGYKTDIALAKKLMLEVVESNSDVLEDPAPSVYFVRHADSTLDFEIRAYVSDVSKRLMTTHAINEGAHLALTNAGINLAYPQRDIHIISNIDSNAIPQPQP